MLYAFTVLLAAFAFAEAPHPSTPHVRPSPYFGAGPVSNVIIRGAPYSAEGRSQDIQTLADGTQISGPVFTWKFFRDSEGRTRVERPFFTGVAPEASLTAARRTIIEIRDPVSFNTYTFDSVKKDALRRHLDPLSPEPVAAANYSQVQSEYLGTQTLEGVLCEGTRTTTSPTSVITEVWKSPSLQLVFLNKVEDPQIGERIQKLINFSPVEPSADLFQPPPNYRSQDDRTTMPLITHKVEPAYSEAARRAKYSGSVLLSVVVDSNGRPQDIKIVRPLGLGLDEQAVKAVSKWRFKPGTRNGRPVATPAQIEVSFRLL